MANYVIRFDLRAVNAVLTHSKPLRRELKAIAERGVEYAKSIAPDAPPLREGYVEGLKAVVRTEHAVRGYVVSTDWKTWWIEKGTAPHATGKGGQGGAVISSPAHHVLSRTLDHLR